MKNQQIKEKILANKQMLGEYACRMNNTAGDQDLKNMKLHAMFEKCMDKIDRLERTLSIREFASAMKSA
jgi:hypothetical protein